MQEYIMQNAEPDEAQAGIKIAGIAGSCKDMMDEKMLIV